jgi:hypothetical protein
LFSHVLFGVPFGFTIAAAPGILRRNALFAYH